MNLEEARRILQERPGMHLEVAASAYLSSFYNHEGKRLLRPATFATTDAAPAAVRPGDDANIGFRPGEDLSDTHQPKQEPAAMHTLDATISKIDAALAVIAKRQ